MFSSSDESSSLWLQVTYLAGPEDQLLYPGGDTNNCHLCSVPSASSSCISSLGYLAPSPRKQSGVRRGFVGELYTDVRASFFVAPLFGDFILHFSTSDSSNQGGCSSLIGLPQWPVWSRAKSWSREHRLLQLCSFKGCLRVSFRLVVAPQYVQAVFYIFPECVIIIYGRVTLA